LQRVYSREDYCLFAVIPTGVLMMLAALFFVCYILV